MTKTESDSEEQLLPSAVASSMRTKDKGKYVQKVILDTLDAHRARGLSISELEEITGFSRETLSKYLEILVASREAYKAGENSARYHKNGRIVHHHHMDNKLFGNRLYTFYELNNPDGDFIFLQEKELGQFKTIRDKGGIMIAKGDLARFMTELKAFAGEIARDDKENEKK